MHTINKKPLNYLKSLEILIQHYTVPVAIGKSINDAPAIFREGLQELEETGQFPYKDGQNVKYAGIISNIKKKYTKNNKIMAFVTIEDLHGSMEIIVFENCYQASANSLMEDNIIMVEGRLSVREDEGDITIIASKISDFSSAVNNIVSIPNKRSTLKVDITNITEEQKNRLKGAIRFFQGDRNNTVMQVINEGNLITSKAILLNELILSEFEEIVGKENCKIEN